MCARRLAFSRRRLRFSRVTTGSTLCSIIGGHVSPLRGNLETQHSKTGLILSLSSNKRVKKTGRKLDVPFSSRDYETSNSLDPQEGRAEVSCPAFKRAESAESRVKGDRGGSRKRAGATLR